MASRQLSENEILSTQPLKAGFEILAYERRDSKRGERPIFYHIRCPEGHENWVARDVSRPLGCRQCRQFARKISAIEHNNAFTRSTSAPKKIDEENLRLGRVRRRIEEIEEQRRLDQEHESFI